MKLILQFVCVLSCFFVDSAEGFRKRIHGGTPILRTDPPAEQLKYVVGLKIKKGEDYFGCGGGIIHEKYILSVAHCFTKNIEDRIDGAARQKLPKLQVTALINAINLNERPKENEPKLFIEIQATKIYFTRTYMENGLDDIAILELKYKLDVNAGVQFKILLRPLPIKKADGRKARMVYSTYENAVAVIAGFGDDEIGPNDDSLKMAHARIVDPETCSEIFDRWFDKYRDMCAIAVTPNNQKPDTPLGACQGDSGSPLVLGDTVIGVFKATGKTCDARDDEEAPQIYIRVSYYKDFISNVLLTKDKKLAKTFEL